jgi:hypothetical protein
VLTLDRVLVTPPPGEVQADAARLQASLDLVASNWQPGDPDLEVLLAGQLTLGRLEAFDAWCRSSDLAAHLTWTAPWEQHQDLIRPLLEASWRLPDPLPFDEAQARIGTGDFDLVVVPLAWGTEVTALEALDAPRAAAPHAVAPRGEQPAVVWVPVEAPLAAAELGARLLPGGTDLDHLGLGLVQGLDGPGLLPAGHPVRGPLPLARLHLRAELRSLVDRSELFARLAAASEGPFVPALASLLEAQTRSSPWAEPDERLELDAAHLEALVAATTTPPEPLERLTWAHLARALVAQRLSGESLALLPDLLGRTGPFAELEHALARAYFELLMPAEGAELLLPLYEAGWRAPGPLMDLAWALGQTGDWERAAEVYGAVLEVLPELHAAARLRAMAELRAGLPEGRDHALELLEEDPEDAELAAYLQPGPLPAPPEGFDPNPLVSLGDGHDH